MACRPVLNGRYREAASSLPWNVLSELSDHVLQQENMRLLTSRYGIDGLTGV